jgi:hypothetical protein
MSVGELERGLIELGQRLYSEDARRERTSKLARQFRRAPTRRAYTRRQHED